LLLNTATPGRARLSTVAGVPHPIGSSACARCARRSTSGP